MTDRTARVSDPVELSRRIRRSSTVAGDYALDEETEVNLGPLAQRLGYFVRRAQVAIFQDFEATCGALGIRPVQYSILTIIEHNPGLSQARVAETLGIKTANFVAMLDTLEARSLVRRAATPGDRRSHALVLTGTGKTLMRKLHKLVADHESRIIAIVGSDMHRRMFGPLDAIARMRTGRSRRRSRL